MGRRANRGRTAAEAWTAGIAADDSAVHATTWVAARWTWVTDVEHVCSKPCPRRLGVRLLRHRHGQLSGHLYIRRVGGRHSPYRPLERHGASTRGLGPPAVPDDHPRRPAAPLRDSRSRPRLLGSRRRDANRRSDDSAQDTRTISAGECVLRTADRHDSPRVSGLGDSAQRAASPSRARRVGRSLQPGTPACRLGTWAPRPSSKRSTRTVTPASAASRLSRGGEAGAGRASSRISTELGGMSAAEIAGSGFCGAHLWRTPQFSFIPRAIG